MASPAKSSPISHRLLLAIIVAAIGLRVYGITGSSLWLDEFCSMECSTGRGLAHLDLSRDVVLADPPALTTLHGALPWWRIWVSMDTDNHPPLYFILLRWWRDVMGESDAAARAMSIAPSVLAILLIFDAARHSAGTSAATWSAALMAVAGPQIHFAQEARGYSVLIAAGAAAFCAMVRIESFGASRARLAGLGAATLVMALTHYFAVASIAALAVYAAVRWRGRARWSALLAMAAALVVFAIIWGPYLWRQRHSVAINNAWQFDPAAGHVGKTLGRLAVLPMRFFVEPPSAMWIPSACVGALAWVAPLLLIRRHPRLLMWYLWMIAPAVLVGMLDLSRGTKHAELIRYAVVASPGAFVLLAAALNREDATSARPWLQHALPAVATAIALLGLRGAYSTAQDWSNLAATLRTVTRPGDLIVFASAGRDDWYACALYLGTSHYDYPPPAPVVILGQSPHEQLLQSIHQTNTIWLVAGSPDFPPDRVIPGLVPRDHLLFPDVGMLWQLQNGNARTDTNLAGQRPATVP
jgi:uncharacterized membrane protein